MQRSPKTRGMIIGLRAGLISGLLAVLISLRYPFFLNVYIVTVLALMLGAYYGLHYIRKESKNLQWLKILFWSNTITWIVPPVGFFTCSASRVINVRNQGEDRKQYLILARICLILSFINAVILAKYVL
jgi:hypothetical protein